MGAGGPLAPLEFRVSEKRIEREIDSLLHTISTPRFENLKTALAQYAEAGCYYKKGMIENSSNSKNLA